MNDWIIVFTFVQVELLNPKPGYFEIEPEALWGKIVAVIEDAVKGKQIFIFSLQAYMK